MSIITYSTLLPLFIGVEVRGILFLVVQVLLINRHLEFAIETTTRVSFYLHPDSSVEIRHMGAHVREALSGHCPVSTPPVAANAEFINNKFI